MNTELENKLWRAADQQSAYAKFKSSEYFYPIMSLIFQKYTNKKLEETTKKLQAKYGKSTNLTYDDNYNVSSKTVGSVTTDFTYNASDQLTNTDDGTNSTDFVYDNTGRMTSYGPHQIFLLSQDGKMENYYFGTDKQSQPISPFSTLITIPTGWTDFQYDDKGNVTKVTKPNNDTIEFKYYATGKRAKKIVTVGSTVTTYKYHWDGDLPVKIDKTVGETTTSTYFTFRKPGVLLTMTVGDDTYFYVQNIRGDITAMLDSSGNQVASYIYDTWGKPTISNPNNLPNPFLYQGSYATFYDDEFGMYGMGARHYNPATMRFVSRDLNHGTLTNTMSQNLYIYCYNNPLGFKDPSGFSPVSCGVAGGLTGDTGMPYKEENVTPQPISNGVPEFNDERKDAAYTAWLAAEGRTGTAADVAEFQHLWNAGTMLAGSMRKYDNKSLNENDIEIAFWCVYWNKKAGMGLSGSQLVEFANVIKAICYLESRCGTDKSAVDEGIMQVKDGGRYAKDGGWIREGFNLSMNVNNKVGLNAGLYVGIAHYLRTYASMNYGFSTSTLDAFRSVDKSGILNDPNKRGEAYKLAARAYGGDNDFVVNYFHNVLGYQYPTDKKDKSGMIIWKGGRWGLKEGWGNIANPYGDAVWALATTGSYTEADGSKRTP